MSTTGSAVIDPDQPHVIHVAGDIDMATAHVLTEAVQRALSRAPDGSTLYVDLSHLSFIDSVGLSALVKAAHEVDALGRQLVLRNVPQRAGRLIEMTQLDTVLVIQGPSEAGNGSMDPSAAPRERL